MFKIIQKRKIWLSFSGAMVVLSIIFLALWGLNFGIDFTGGSLLEVEFKDRPAVNEIQAALQDLNLGSSIIQPIGDRGMILRFQDISEATHQEVMHRLRDLVAGSEVEESGEYSADNSAEIELNSTSSDFTGEVEADNEAALGLVEELRFDSVGPTIGEELKRKSITAIVIVLVAIVLYIAWVFRKVSKPVASWKYGISAIIALFHDVMITLGVFAVLGEFFAVEINAAFVAAILTVLGYSVNDTIVVFDRVRENLPKSDEDFEGTVNISVNQTIKRSINTSVTTLLVLLSILFFGGGSIRDFVLALSIGVFVGTYSSIFLASPVLVVWESLMRRK